MLPESGKWRKSLSQFPIRTKAYKPMICRIIFMYFIDGSFLLSYQYKDIEVKHQRRYETISEIERIIFITPI